MEPKYRTLIQAALFAMLLAFVAIGRSADKSDGAVAEKATVARH
jgi:hypothetical protein